MSAQITKMFITGIYGNCMANIGENILKKAWCISMYQFSDNLSCLKMESFQYSTDGPTWLVAYVATDVN
jgi:hypothetical protein